MTQPQLQQPKPHWSQAFGQAENDAEARKHFKAAILVALMQGKLEEAERLRNIMREYE